MQKIPTNILWPLVVLVIAFGAFFLKPWQTNQQETISVSAEGKVDTTPNVGKITATIESKNPNIDTARAENEKKISTVTVRLKEIGIEEKDIKTQNLSAGQGYSGAEIMMYPTPTKPDTNVFSTTLTITIRDFTMADQVLATLTQNGLTNLYGPELTVSDDKLEEAKSAARANAIENAKKKATELAEASDRKVGKVVKISEGADFGYPVPMMARDSAELTQKASPIQPGQNQITTSVSVDFQLK